MNFVSSDLLQHDHMFGKRFRLTCGSLPPILCLNHEYRNMFLDRFTKPGITRSQTTLSIEDALKLIDNEERNTTLRDSFNDGSPSAFPIYSTRTQRNIIYDPEDVIWIQGDFWLDELRRSALARSTFHNLKYLAIPYKTRRKSLFELEDMLNFLGCIISTFANLKGLILVLEVEDVVPERPIYNGEIHFYAPEKIRMVSGVPQNVSAKSRETLSSRWRKKLGKPVASPEVQSHTEYWSARLLASDAWHILDYIKARAINAGNRGCKCSSGFADYQRSSHLLIIRLINGCRTSICYSLERPKRSSKMGNTVHSSGYCGSEYIQRRKRYSAHNQIRELARGIGAWILVLGNICTNTGLLHAVAAATIASVFN